MVAAKLLVNVEEGRSLPIKIELPISALSLNGDGCCKKILITLRIFVLAALLVLLSWTAVTLFAVYKPQSTFQSERNTLISHEPLFSSENNKLALRKKIYESIKEDNANSKFNDVDVAPASFENVPFSNTPTGDSTDNINSKVTYDPPFEIQQFGIAINADSVVTEEIQHKDFVESTKNTLDKLAEEWHHFDDELQRIEKITAEDKQILSDMTRDIKEEKAVEEATKTVDEEVPDLMFIDHLIRDFMQNNDVLRNIDESHEDEDNVPAVMHVIHDMPEDTQHILKGTKNTDDIVESLLKEIISSIPSSDETREFHGGPVIIVQEINDSAEEHLEKFGDSENKSENDSQETLKLTDFEQNGEKISVRGSSDLKQNEEKINVGGSSDLEKQINQETFSVDEKSPEIINNEDLTTIKASFGSMVNADAAVLTAKYLEPIVGQHKELLSWYYENRNDPNFLLDNDKKKIFTAKLLYSPNILEFTMDADILLNLVFGDSYIQKFTELMNSPNEPVMPESATQLYIAGRLMNKAIMEQLVNKGLLESEKIKITIEHLNKVDLNDHKGGSTEINVSKYFANSKEEKINNLDGLFGTIIVKDRFGEDSDEIVEPRQSYWDAMDHLMNHLKESSNTFDKKSNERSTASSEGKSVELERKSSDSEEKSMANSEEIITADSEKEPNISSKEKLSGNLEQRRESIIDAMKKVAIFDENEHGDGVINEKTEYVTEEKPDELEKEYQGKLESLMTSIKIEDDENEPTKDMNEYLTFYGDEYDY